MKENHDFDYKFETVSRNGKEGTINNVVNLKRYRGNEESVVCPNELEGFPVTSLIETFAWQTRLERVTLPKHLKNISKRTFYHCRKLKSIKLPSTLKQVGDNAFAGCTSLEKISLPFLYNPAEKLRLGPNSFLNCPKLCDKNGFIILKTLLVAYYGKESHVIIPKGIEKVAEGAFYENKTVISVTMPNSVKEMGRSAFFKCLNLETVTLSDSLQTLTEHSFFGCEKLKSIHLPEALRHISTAAFRDCVNLREIHWNDALKSIEKEAFLHCHSLEEISFPNNLVSIQNSFTNCENLRKITIPPSVQTIDCLTFDHCFSLEVIELLERGQDSKTRDLTYFTLPYTTKMRENLLEQGQDMPIQVAKVFKALEIEEYYRDLLTVWDKISEESKDIFRTEWTKKIDEKMKRGKNQLRNLVFLEQSAKEMSIYFAEGCHLELVELTDYLDFSISKNNTAETAVLLDYKYKNFDKEFLDTRESRQELLDLGLELPTLEELSTKWEVDVHQNHIELQGYLGKNRVEFLPPSLEDGTPILCLSGTPHGFQNLVELTLSEGLEKIDENCFQRSELERINLPETLTKLMPMAFYRTKLREIVLPSSLNTICTSTFYGCHFLEKIILPETIIEISQSAFAYCVLLTDITIPEGVKKINDSVFFHCISLKNVSLPDSLTFLGDSCFKKCYNLEEIHLPIGLLEVGSECFADCSNLKKVFLTKGRLKIGKDVWKNCPVLEFIGREGGKNLLEILKS